MPDDKETPNDEARTPGGTVVDAKSEKGPSKWRRWFSRRSEPSEAPAVTAALQEMAEQRSPLEAKMHTVMDGLEKKDDELGGGLVEKFGKGPSRFMVVKPLFVDGRANEFDDNRGNGRKDQGLQDHLVVTPEGFMVLRVVEGTYLKQPSFQGQDKAEWEDQLVRSDSNSVINSRIRHLLHRGSARNHLRASGQNPAEGSGYAHEVKDERFRKGDFYSLDFGEDRKITFQLSSDRQNAYVDAVSSEIQDEIKPDLQYKTGMQAGPLTSHEVLSDIQAMGHVRLITQPSAEHVNAILKHGMETAKRNKDLEDQRKAAENARKEEQQSVEEPAQEKEDDTQKRTEEQARSADDVLSLLSET